jgi:hypothetical protein
MRSGMLHAVYHGENGLRTLQELARTYQVVSTDLKQVMNRLKALYRSWGIPCTGTQVYGRRYCEQWLQKIKEAGVRRRAGLYQQLDGLQGLRLTVRGELLAESRKHARRRIAIVLTVVSDCTSRKSLIILVPGGGLEPPRPVRSCGF